VNLNPTMELNLINRWQLSAGLASQAYGGSIGKD